MTESRETVRRRQWRDTRGAGPDAPSAGDVDLRTLCIVQGCIRPRVGSNLCRWHANETDPDA